MPALTVWIPVSEKTSHAVDIVIVDSVAALVPKAEIDGDMGDSHVGLQPLDYENLALRGIPALTVCKLSV